MKSSFVIVADRGNLKAFRVEKGPATRGAHLHQVQAFTFADGHSKPGEVNTDEAGRYGNSTSDKHYELEADRRTSKNLAHEIEKLLGAEHPAAWSFAAPAEIEKGVLSHLAAEWKKTLAESVAHDLVKTPTANLADHFDSLRTA